MVGVAAFFAVARADFSLAAPTAPTATSVTAAADPESPSWFKNRINLRTNPIGLLYKAWGGGFDLRVSKSVAIGASFYFLDEENQRRLLQIEQYALSAIWFINAPAFTNSFYTRVSAGYVPVQRGEATNGLMYAGHYDAAGFFLSLGRNWHVWSGLSLSAGVGMSWYFGKEHIILRSNDGQIVSHPAPFDQDPNPRLEATLSWVL